MLTTNEQFVVGTVEKSSNDSRDRGGQRKLIAPLPKTKPRTGKEAEKLRYSTMEAVPDHVIEQAVASENLDKCIDIVGQAGGIDFENTAAQFFEGIDEYDWSRMSKDERVKTIKEWLKTEHEDDTGAALTI
jgi:hypothetical protein